MVMFVVRRVCAPLVGVRAVGLSAVVVAVVVVYVKTYLSPPLLVAVSPSFQSLVWLEI